MTVYGVILAGGGGTRFWPLSRKDLPKQFLNLTGSDLMINETIERIHKITGKENIFVVTGRNQAELAGKVTGERLLPNHILAEPAARNTAACIGYAAMEILRKYGDGVMCVLPSDHYIRDEEAYAETLSRAVRVAEQTDALVTIGIKPAFPATGYGYIRYEQSEDGTIRGEGQPGDDCDIIAYHNVREFVEKPDLATAKGYVKDGHYSWNSGVFVWKASVILDQFEKLLPDIYQYLCEIGEAMGTGAEQSTIDRVYPVIPKISIDYGIMERADRVVMLDGDFGWSDVGSWDALPALYPTDENGNVLYGEQIHIDTHNCISYAKTKLIAALGVEDLIIVEADDAVLVCRKDMAQQVGKVVEQLKSTGKDQFL